MEEQTEHILHLLDEMNKHRKEIKKKYGLKNNIDVDNIENHWSLIKEEEYYGRQKRDGSKT